MTENDEFVLTAESYYSQEANRRYMSVHQYLSFAGHMGVHGCEAKAMAELRGDYVQETTKPMLIGSYVDSYFEGTLPEFKLLHPEIFTQKGELKSDFKRAEKMIERAEQDELFMQTMAGQKQVIMTAYLFGCDWKIKMDSYLPGTAIVDLKTTSDLHGSWNVPEQGRVGVLDYWGYILQGAVYQKVVEINTGDILPVYFSFITKEEEPDIEVVYVDQDSLDAALEEIAENMPSVLAVKNGEVKPARCGDSRCVYCRRTKKLTAPILYTEL